MIEPEMAFCDLKGDMAVMEAMLKFVIKDVLKNAPDELKFLNDFVVETHDLIEKLERVANSDFKVITYTEAVDYLKNSGEKFEYPVEWGMDFYKEHEIYICEKVAKGPVFLIDFPKDIKAFYMKLNPDGKTVAACDLLVPGVGELIGGSQREENYDVLSKRWTTLGWTRSRSSGISTSENSAAWFIQASVSDLRDSSCMSPACQTSATFCPMPEPPRILSSDNPCICND